MKFINVLMLILLGCGGPSDKEALESVKKIILNSSQSKLEYDVTPLLEQSVEVIKLETTSDCLVRADGNTFFTKDRIFISDKILKKVFMFDWNGKYLKSFGVVGRGPGEYVDLGDYFVKADSLYIQDRQQNKIVVFPLDGGKPHEFYLDPPIRFNEFFELDDRFYFVTGYSNDYNLIRLDPTDGKRKCYLPYEPEINQKNQQWELNEYVSKYRDTAHLIYPRIDTIYKVFSNTVYPEYAVNFVHNKIPESLLNQTGTEILRTSMDKGYILGLEKICVSRDYIFGYFGEGKKIQEFVYFKAKGECVIAESLILKSLGKLRALNYSVTDHDEFIFIYDALSLKETWHYIASRNPFLREEDREKLRNLVESLQDEDNPVLFKCKLKKSNEISTPLF